MSIKKVEINDDSILDKVINSIKSTESTERTILIDGLPGVGKTALLIDLIKSLYKSDKETIKVAVGAPTSGALQCILDQLSIEERLWIDTFDVPQLINEEFANKIKKEYDLFIIDNAGCINTAIADGILTLRSTSKIVMAGFLYERLPGLQSYCALVTRNPLDRTQFKYVDARFKLTKPTEELTTIQKIVKEVTGEQSYYKGEKFAFADTEDGSVKVYDKLLEFNDSFAQRTTNKESVVRLFVNRFYEIKRGRSLNYIANTTYTPYLTCIDKRNTKMRLGCRYTINDISKIGTYEYLGVKFKAMEVQFTNIVEPYYMVTYGTELGHLAHQVFNSTRTTQQQEEIEKEFYSNFIIDREINGYDKGHPPNFSHFYSCSMNNALNQHWDHVYFDIGELLGTKYNKEKGSSFSYSDELFNLLVIFAASRAKKTFNILTSKYA